MAELFSWQKPSADRLEQILRQSTFALDASSVGTGKTYTACEVLRRLDRRALIICPKSAIGVWERVSKEMDVYSRVLSIINIESLRAGKLPGFYANGSWESFPPGAMVIHDEVHRGASGPDTLTTAMLAKTKLYKVPVLALSATIADSPLKMRAIGFLLGLHNFNRGDYTRWCFHNGCFTIPGQQGLRFPKGEKGQLIMGAIHEKIKDQMVRLRIQDIKDFPECDTQANLYSLDKRSTSEINQIYKEMDDHLKQPHSNIMVELLRARQRVELFKIPLLLELAEDLLEEGRSVVLFVNFRDTLKKLYDGLKHHGVSVVHGDQTADERTADVAKFQSNDNHVCVCMTSAGSVALSLHDVLHERPRASLITPGWSAVDLVQCLGRIHRAGGTKAVQSFVLCADTIEERIYRAIKNKMGALSALNGDLTDSDLV